MSADDLNTHGASWRQWILDNLKRGCLPNDMYLTMVKEVWAPDAALSALEAGQALLGRTTEGMQYFPSIAPGDRFEVDGANIEVLSRMERPRCSLIGGLLSPLECLELIAYANSKGLIASSVVDSATGQEVSHSGRTSRSVFMSRAETPLIDTLEKRLAKLTNWPLTHAEGLQVLSYEPGQQYKPHFDWFDPENPGSAIHLCHGGQRVSTTVIYLSAADIGGRTVFPNAGYEVSPPVGGAIFFRDVDALGKPDNMSLHAGTPVENGVKIVATYWQRESSFQ